jgi:single-stranded-DNA-specific exonuclease
MKDMDKAVNRIEEAIANQETILVFGDYDVDGTTAVSLMASYLRSFYPNVATYIPDRYDEGYGISTKGIDFAEDNSISLIIALDCGIKSVDKIAYANSKKIDFIICDHHRPGDELPKAVAVLDPKRSDCNYPYDELCGCGVGFKLIQALAENRNQTIEDLVEYLDLVATAIAADIVPINGENRVLAKFGLEVINSNPRPGIKALVQNVKKKVLTITDVVFIVAPRINAAGRIKHGNEAVALLTEYDLEQAEQFASEIEQHNSDRKELDKQITKEALLQIEENNEQIRFSTVVYQENWHKGVIGIVASRLVENYYRPTIVFTKSGEKLAASARSVKDFDV